MFYRLSRALTHDSGDIGDRVEGVYPLLLFFADMAALRPLEFDKNETRRVYVFGGYANTIIRIAGSKPHALFLHDESPFTSRRKA